MSKSRLFSKLIGSDGKVRDDNVKEMMAHAGGVQTKSFGSSSLVPVLTVNRQGKITAISTTAVAGVDSVAFNSASGELAVNTSNGASHTANIGAFVDTKISALIGDAPASMDTLSEIADSLGDDPDYATNLNIQAMNTAASIIDLQDKYITEHV
jgi:hypothetical protein